MIIRFAFACVLILTVGCTPSSPPIPDDAMAPQTFPLELAKQELGAPETSPERKLALSVNIGQMLQASEQTRDESLAYFEQGVSLWEQHSESWESREDLGALGMLGAQSYFEVAQVSRKRAQATVFANVRKANTLQRSFRARTTFIIEADKFYTKATMLASIHGERSTLRAQSVYEMARQYDEFASELLKTTAPSTLSPEQAQAFTETLATYASPLLERAQRHYLLVVDLPVESKEGRAVVAKAQARLDALKAR